MAATLVAAYAFDEGSGTVATDASGTGNVATVNGPAWVAGKYGNALSFDGVNDIVSVADANSLDLTSGMTLEAWVKPASVSNWSTVLLKERAHANELVVSSDMPSGPSLLVVR